MMQRNRTNDNKDPENAERESSHHPIEKTRNEKKYIRIMFQMA